MSEGERLVFMCVQGPRVNGKGFPCSLRRLLNSIKTENTARLIIIYNTHFRGKKKEITLYV